MAVDTLGRKDGISHLLGAAGHETVCVPGAMGSRVLDQARFGNQASHFLLCAAYHYDIEGPNA